MLNGKARQKKGGRKITMNKKRKRATIGLLTAMIFAISAVSPVLAYSDEGNGSSAGVSILDSQEEETGAAKEEASLHTEWTIMAAPDKEGEGILTPQGNLTLIDDIDEEHSEALQYMTVQTKNGNTFYLIVDRSGKDNNVYFLNMVDEADLLSLLDEDTQEKFKKAMEKETSVEEKETGDTLLFSNQKQEVDNPKEGNKVTEDATGSLNPFLMLILFGLLGAGVAGGYYFFKIKPGKEASEINEDVEFVDDEDYIEDEVASEEPSENEEELDGYEDGYPDEDGFSQE